MHCVVNVFDLLSKFCLLGCACQTFSTSDQPAWHSRQETEMEKVFKVLKFVELFLMVIMGEYLDIFEIDWWIPKLDEDL